MTEIWHKARSYLAAGVALVACPCHLVVTLPLLLSLTAGTAVGVFLGHNPWVVVVVSTALFLGGLALAFHWQGQEGGSCPMPSKSARATRLRQDRPAQAQTTQRGEGGAL